MGERTARRYSDRISREQKHRISRLAFLLAGLLIFVSAVSLVFVGYVATRASEGEADRNAGMLFENTLRDRSLLIAREQLPLARWDEAVEKIVIDFDHDFVRQELKSLWTDFGHDRNLIVNAQNVVLAETFQDYTHIVLRPLSDTPEYSPLVQQARDVFKLKRTRVPRGFSYSSLQELDMKDIAASGFVVLEDKPALVSVIPIIPDQERVALPRDEATLLISAHFIDQDFVNGLNSQIRFEDMRFQFEPSADNDEISYPLESLQGEIIGYFIWDKLPVAAPIWHTVIPVILALSIALAIMAFAIAWRIGRLTASLQASEHQNRFLALHDTLSGLANRLHFNRTLAEAVNTLSYRPFALMHCDLDRFKAVNDTHGHAAGDAVIREVAARLKTVVGDAGLACRVGGDEFVIILNDLTDRIALQKLAGRLLDAVPLPIDIGDGELAEVGISIGIAIAPDNGLTPEEVQAAADGALYKAKNAGRGRMAFADPAGENDAAAQRAEVEKYNKAPSSRPASAAPAG